MDCSQIIDRKLMLRKTYWLTDKFHESCFAAPPRSVDTNGGWCVKRWAQNHRRCHHVCVLLGNSNNTIATSYQNNLRSWHTPQTLTRQNYATQQLKQYNIHTTRATYIYDETTCSNWLNSPAHSSNPRRGFSLQSFLLQQSNSHRH